MTWAAERLFSVLYGAPGHPWPDAATAWAQLIGTAPASTTNTGVPAHQMAGQVVASSTSMGALEGFQVQIVGSSNRFDFVLLPAPSGPNLPADIDDLQRAAGVLRRLTRKAAASYVPRRVAYVHTLVEKAPDAAVASQRVVELLGGFPLTDALEPNVQFNAPCVMPGGWVMNRVLRWAAVKEQVVVFNALTPGAPFGIETRDVVQFVIDLSTVDQPAPFEAELVADRLAALESELDLLTDKGFERLQ